jgi:hypothetical protein
MRWSDEDKRQWHKWFAWHPVFLNDPNTEADVTIWLEPVWRKRIDGNYWPYWVYNGSVAKPCAALMEKKDE